MNNREIHYKYAISYLVLSLILSIGFGLYKVPNLVEKASFALTLTSLVLGIIAIIYTFLSANKQENLLTKLIETNHDISKASSLISNIATTLSDQIKSIPPRLDSVDEKLENLTQTALSTLSPSVQSQLIESIPSTDNKEPTLQNLKEFVGNLKFAGMYSLYLISKSYNKNIKIDEELTSKISDIPFSYILGIAHATEAAGFIKTNYYKNKYLKIESLSEVFLKNLEEEIIKIINILENNEEHILKKLKEEVDKNIKN